MMMSFLKKEDNQEIVNLKAGKATFGDSMWVIIDPSNDSQFNCMMKDVPAQVSVCAGQQLNFRYHNDTAQGVDADAEGNLRMHYTESNLDHDYIDYNHCSASYNYNHESNHAFYSNSYCNDEFNHVNCNTNM